MPNRRRAQPWPIRLTHLANLPLLVIMAGSGLEIFAAYPELGPRGAPWTGYPLAGGVAPAWLRLGEWPAGARHWHFAFAWFFVLNGLIYLTYFFAGGEWRRRLFSPRRDGRNALATLAYYLRLREQPPASGLYNGLQRLTYTGVLLLAALSVLSGLAMYKPVQLRLLGWPLGGYDGARAIHLGALMLLFAFALVHVLMVALHPRTLAAMATGGRDE